MTPLRLDQPGQGVGTLRGDMDDDRMGGASAASAADRTDAATEGHAGPGQTGGQEGNEPALRARPAGARGRAAADAGARERFDRALSVPAEPTAPDATAMPLPSPMALFAPPVPDASGSAVAAHPVDTCGSSIARDQWPNPGSAMPAPTLASVVTLSPAGAPTPLPLTEILGAKRERAVDSRPPGEAGDDNSVLETAPMQTATNAAMQTTPNAAMQTATNAPMHIQRAADLVPNVPQQLSGNSLAAALAVGAAAAATQALPLAAVDRILIDAHFDGRRRVRARLADEEFTGTEVEIGEDAGALLVAFHCSDASVATRLRGQAQALASRLVARLARDVLVQVHDEASGPSTAFQHRQVAPGRAPAGPTDAA